MWLSESGPNWTDRSLSDRREVRAAAAGAAGAVEAAARRWRAGCARVRVVRTPNAGASVGRPLATSAPASGRALEGLLDTSFFMPFFYVRSPVAVLYAYFTRSGSIFFHVNCTLALRGV